MPISRQESAPWLSCGTKKLILVDAKTPEDTHMSMLQLDPPIPLVTPKGEGFAHVLLDYGPESDLYWTVLITQTGEIWTYANRYVRAGKNITLGRTQPNVPEDDQHHPAPFRGNGGAPLASTVVGDGAGERILA